MTDIPLARDNASAEKHIAVLKNLVDRYESVHEPVNYKETAIGGIGNSAASSALSYWSEIELVDKVKSGVYTPSDAIVGYYEDDFDPSKESAEAVKSILNSYEPFKEAQYVLSRGDYEDRRQLAGDIISIEEGLSDDELGDLTRSLEIIDGLNLLSSTTSERAESNTSAGMSDPTEEDANLQINDNGVVNYANADFDAKDLPRYAGPEYLISVLKVMESGGSWTSDEIEENDSIEIDKRNINGTLDYGFKLGFLEKSNGGYIPTSVGFELFYNSDDVEEVAATLKTATKDFKPYVTLLEAVYTNLGDFKNEQTIKNEDIISVLRTEFEYTEVSIDTLKRSINTLFETLDGMAYGERKSGSGLPTRLSFHDDTSLETIINDICIDSPHSTLFVEERSDGEEEQLAGNDNVLLDDANEPKGSGIGEPPVDHRREDPSVIQESSSSKDVTHPDPVEAREYSPEAQHYSKVVNVDVNISIDLAKLDSAELEAKLELINKYVG